jgi:hypothetical protein
MERVSNLIGRHAVGKINAIASDSAIVARIEAEIERIRSLSLDAARGLWKTTFRKEVPKALTRDLLVRMLTWHFQEQAFGGHDRATLKILESYAHGRPGEVQKVRYLKPGTEIIRECQGERHTVTVTAEGFRWRDGNYPSLTAIARIITGTSCNGPRFFGLRMAGEGLSATAARPTEASRQTPAAAIK